MKNPDLDSVLKERREAFSTTTPTPRIGIAQEKLNEVAVRGRATEILESTSADLKKIAEKRKQTLNSTFSLPAAVLFTGMTILGAIILSLVGSWLLDVGLSIDLGSSD